MPVKVSVFLDEELHQKLKMASIQQGTSIQNVMETAAQKVVDPEQSHPRFTPKEIRVWQSKLKRVLEKGDRLGTLDCTASIDASYQQLERTGNNQPGTLESQIFSIRPNADGEKHTVRKTG